MSFSDESQGPVKCKSFISEAEIEELKKKRQDEWEKVRKPEDPVEAPEEEYDPRSLYDRLQEQKDKRQAEFEESHRLKNLIKGLDDDEVAFLELVDKAKVERETKLWNEEMREIQEFKKAVASISEEESEARLQEIRKTLRLQMQNSSRKSQQALLSAAVKRKSSDITASQEKKHCTGLKSDSKLTDKPPEKEDVKNGKAEVSSSNQGNLATGNFGARRLQCLGVLPGLGAYTDSSDSENSSNSENEKESDFDLIDGSD